MTKEPITFSRPRGINLSKLKKYDLGQLEHVSENTLFDDGFLAAERILDEDRMHRLQIEFFYAVEITLRGEYHIYEGL